MSIEDLKAQLEGTPPRGVQIKHSHGITQSISVAQQDWLTDPPDQSWEGYFMSTHYIRSVITDPEVLKELGL